MPTDEELILQLQQGHTEALAILARRWEAPLLRFVSGRVRGHDDARDICQETFLRVLNRASAFRPGSKFSTWLYQIALNLCRDEARRRGRRRRLGLVDSHDSDPAERAGSHAPRAASAGVEASDVMDAVRRLEPELQEIVWLKEFEGFTFRDIAEILDCPESTVKSRMYRALDRLRALWFAPDRPPQSSSPASDDAAEVNHGLS